MNLNARGVIMFLKPSYQCRNQKACKYVRSVASELDQEYWEGSGLTQSRAIIPQVSVQNQRLESEGTMSEGGKKFDQEKPRLDLLPVDPLEEVAKVLTLGAKKYSERNWEEGILWGRCYAAALRHLFSWHRGETQDPETGLNHLAHAACNILFLLEFSKTHPELDNRPKKR